MEFLECAPSGLLGRLLLRNWDSFLCLGAVFFCSAEFVAFGSPLGSGFDFLQGEV